RLIDEIPILAVVATQAQGTTRFRGIGELRLKETDRISALTQNLRAMGADVAEEKDNFLVNGPASLEGARIQSHADHRIAMAFAIAATHRSFADPPLVGVSVPREVHFLAKRELFRFKPFGWLIGQLNAHPLNRRAGDVSAIRQAQRILKDGHVLIVFPEGRRS